MSEQNVTKKKTNKLLVVVLIILLTTCCTLGYLIISGKFSGTAKQPKEYSTNLGEFIVNLNDPSPTYIKTTISIGYTNKKSSKTITSKLPQIKDCINKFMLSKTSTDFGSNTIDGTGDALIGKINETLGSELLTDIYFEQIIIQ